MGHQRALSEQQTRHHQTGSAGHDDIPQQQQDVASDAPALPQHLSRRSRYGDDVRLHHLAGIIQPGIIQPGIIQPGIIQPPWPPAWRAAGPPAWRCHPTRLRRPKRCSRGKAIPRSSVPTTTSGPQQCASCKDAHVFPGRWVRSRASVSPRKKAGDFRFQTIISRTPNTRLSTPMTNTMPIPANDPLEPNSGLAI